MQQRLEEVAHLPHGIDVCYDTFGDRENPALLLIMGLGGPLIWWSPELCELLAERGFFVIRYDNRDVGKSTKLDEVSVRRADVVKTFVRTKTPPPYTLSDMASDGMGLLDVLGIERAHVTGVSMGGMIAQTMAIEHPDRVLSLVSIMATTGRRSVGWQDPRLLPRLIAGRTSRQQFIAQSVITWGAIGSPGYATSQDEVRERAAQTFDRGISAAGVARQTLAVLAQPDRSRSLRELDVPALVIHGTADRLVHVSGGRATARALPNAELMLIPGMGHDLPRELWTVYADGIERTAKRAGLASTR